MAEFAFFLLINLTTERTTAIQNEARQAGMLDAVSDYLVSLQRAAFSFDPSPIYCLLNNLMLNNRVNKKKLASQAPIIARLDTVRRTSIGPFPQSDG